MNRLVRPLFPLLVGVAVMASGLLAQAQPPKSQGPSPKPGGGMGMMGMPGIPGFWLQNPQVQRQLKLTDEQKQKVGEIVGQYATEMQQRWGALRDLPPEEQREKMAELQKALAKRAQDARKEAEAILSPQQLTQLKQRAFRAFALSMLADPRRLDQIEASEDQKGQVRNLIDEFEEKVNKLQEEMFDNALKVLTPEQHRKLQEMQSAGSFPFPVPRGTLMQQRKLQEMQSAGGPGF